MQIVYSNVVDGIVPTLYLYLIFCIVESQQPLNPCQTDAQISTYIILMKCFTELDQAPNAHA